MASESSCRKRPAPVQCPPGGHRQKLAWDASARPTSSAPSAVAAVLMEKWAWGELSVPTIQAIAQAGLADGIDKVDLKELASAGSAKNLQDKLPQTPIRDALSGMTGFMKRSTGGIVKTTQTLLLPHTLFAALYEFDKSVFVDKLCGGDPAHIGKFWSCMKNHPMYVDPAHPLHVRSDHTSRCIPLGLHGDGVSVIGINKSWGKSVDALSWCSLLSKGSTLTTNFLIYLMWWQFVIDAANMNIWNAFTNKLAWSFYWLFVGKWPTRDENGNQYDPESVLGQKGGTPLAGGFYAVLWLLKGDLEYMSKAWGFANPGAAERCSCCQANITDVPWTDGRPDAVWRSTVWTLGTWLARFPDRPVLFKQVPGLSILSFIPDIMHTMHLGTYKYFLGSVLELLTHHVMDESPEKNLDRIWQMIQKAYRDNRISEKFDQLKVSMYKRAGQFPSLKGKAAEVRHLLKPMLVVCEHFLDNTIKQHKEIKLALRMAIQMETTLDDHVGDFALPASVAATFSKAAEAFVNLNISLRNHFKETLLFHFTIKYHYMYHIADMARYINPRCGWCYAGESLMHRVRILIQSSCRGVPAHAIGDKALKKYCLALAMSLLRERSGA